MLQRARIKNMKLFLLLFVVAAARGKIIIEKWDMQGESKFGDVKHMIRDSTFLSLDAHPAIDADDVVINLAAYSKVDGVFNPFVHPDPIHVCTVHENEDPLVKYMHDEMLKFGNVTLACPLKKGTYYYVHDFAIDESKFPMPLPEGEFRVDSNVSAIIGGVESHLYSSELFFKTTKD